MAKNKKKYRKLMRPVTLIFVFALFLVFLIAGAGIGFISFNRQLNTYYDMAMAGAEFLADGIGRSSGNYIKISWVDERERENAEGRLEMSESERSVFDKERHADYFMFYDIVSYFYKTFNVNDVYVIAMDKNEDGSIKNEGVIIIDMPDSEGYEAELGEHFSDVISFSALQEVYATGETTKAPTILDNTVEGSILTAYSPICFTGDDYQPGEVYAVVGVEIEMSLVIKNVIAQMFILLVTLMGYLITFAIVYLIIFRIFIISPIRKLSSGMENFSANGAENYKPIKIRTLDEISDMADDFNEMVSSVISYTTNVEKTTVVQERMKFDLDMAGQVRKYVSTDLTYPPFPERTDFDLCGRIGTTVYNKCSFCDYFLIDEDHLFTVVGETIGSSLTALFLSMYTAANIHCFAKMGYEPYRIATEVNKRIFELPEREEGLITNVVISRINLRHGFIDLVNAGMPPVLVKESGEGYNFDTTQVQRGLGSDREAFYDQTRKRLHQGSAILFTSMGVISTKNADGKKFGADRLKDAVNRISGETNDLSEMLERLEAQLDAYRGDAVPELDTAMLEFRFFD